MKENRSALPRGVSFEDVHILRNVKTGIVDLGFDFRVCFEDWNRPDQRQGPDKRR